MAALSFYAYVSAKAGDVVELIIANPALVTSGAEDARDRAQSLASALNFSIGPLKIARRVTLTLGEVVVEPGAWHFPLYWHAERSSWLFPRLHASLEVLALSDTLPECQISLIGDYTPPLGGFGALTDLLLMHQVAQACIHTFVSTLAARLTLAMKSSAPETAKVTQGSYRR
jgi:hypothetical protein